jgi:hypothetical protein
MGHVWFSILFCCLHKFFIFSIMIFHDCNIQIYAWFQASTAVETTAALFCNFTQLKIVYSTQCFRTTYRPHFKVQAFQTETTLRHCLNHKTAQFTCSYVLYNRYAASFKAFFVIICTYKHRRSSPTKTKLLT